MSQFAQTYWWVIFGLIIVLVVAVRQFYKTEKGRWILDSAMLRAPVFRTRVQKSGRS